ncbi:hypothetical protein [Bradyrhizobium sp.]|uniref:hypothetical protein n=1 Tax=Bradyrhizobium sp. TaxID=376 RepID=UPI002D6C6895|nr:hypothetical protein [Bradyrhizobium sp.]HZR76820.1 hypothetical protein [Bradyrhizobium sp.]
MQDHFTAFAGKNEVNTGALELCVEKQLRVGNDDRIRWDVSGVDCFGKKVSAWVLAQSVGNLGIEFAEVIHLVTAMVNKYIISMV